LVSTNTKDSRSMSVLLVLSVLVTESPPLKVSGVQTTV
jgi:hypothetical protein